MFALLELVVGVVLAVVERVSGEDDAAESADGDESDVAPDRDGGAQASERR